MTVRRPMHLITEFAVSSGGPVDAPDAAERVIGAYAHACQALGHTEGVPWENAASRTRYGRALRNGGHLSARPGTVRYTAPDSTTPWRAMCWDTAGVLMLWRALEQLDDSEVVIRKATAVPGDPPRPCDEFYAVAPALRRTDVDAALVPFLVTRQILCGAGRMRRSGDRVQLDISQRADSISALHGETDALLVDVHGGGTVHVSAGDANRLPASTMLKLGTISLVLAVLERRGTVPEQWRALRLADPLGELRAVSADPDLTHQLLLADGRRLTAIEVQRAYLDLVVRDLLAVSDELVLQRGGDSQLPSEVSTPPEKASFPLIPGIDEDTHEALETWSRTLGQLAADPLLAAASVEWTAKLAMLGGGQVPVAELDDRWSDLRKDRSLVQQLEESGALAQIVHPEVLAAAEFAPPPDTRAWLRGELIRRWPDQVRAASLTSIDLDLGPEGVVRVPIPGPLSWTRAEAIRVINQAADLREVVEALRNTGRTAES